LVPILITAIREPFQFFLRDGNHNATQLFGLSCCRGSEARGWSSRGTSVGRDGTLTGATTDGAASPLRASRFAVMVANFAELTGGSPEMMCRYYPLWTPPKGFHNTAVVEALRRFTGDAFSVEA